MRFGKLLYSAILVASLFCISGKLQAATLLSDQMIEFDGNQTDQTYSMLSCQYPDKAQGWKNGVYHRRALVKSKDSSFFRLEQDFLAVQSQMWKENVGGGRPIPYYNTGALSWKADPGDYDIEVAFENPTAQPYYVFLRANGMLQSNTKKVLPGKAAMLKCCVSVVYSELELNFIVHQSADSPEAAEWKTAYVKGLRIKKRETEKAGKIPTIYIAGDSISATRKASRYPCKGWGQELSCYIKHKGAVGTKRHEEAGYEAGWYEYRMNTAVVENRATSGESTNNFRETGKYDSILNTIKPGDYVIVQFGSNDVRKNIAYKSTSVAQYRDNLNYFVDGCKQRGATCILSSSIPRLKYQKSGQVVTVAPKHRKAVQEVAKAKSVTYVNTGKIMDEMMTILGEDAARPFYMCLKPNKYKAYPDGQNDTSHLTEKGAKKLAQVVAGEIKKQRPRSYLSELIDVDTNYYKGLSKIEEVNKIKQIGRGKIKIFWKKVKYAQRYTILQYNRKKQSYIPIKTAKQNSCVLKYRKDHSNIKIRVYFE